MATADNSERIRRLIASMSRKLRDAFLRIIGRARREMTLADLATLFEEGREDEVFDITGRAAAAFAGQVGGVIVVAGEDSMKWIGQTLGAQLDFDRTADEAVAILRDSRFHLIREFQDAQREAVREALVSGTTQGLNPREQARAFRNSIGLTAYQERVIRNYERELRESPADVLRRANRDKRFDRTVARAARTGEPLTDAQVAAMTKRYRERWLKYRSEVIARTEALTAVHQGSDEAFAQSVRGGILDDLDVIQEWNTAGGSRVRDSHDGMDGQQRPLGEPFTSDNGVLLRYPGDPSAPASERVQCRCRKGTRVRLPELA